MKSYFSLLMCITLLLILSCSKSPIEQKVEKFNEESNNLMTEFESLMDIIKSKKNYELVLDFEKKLDTINKNWELEKDSILLLLDNEKIEELENENRERLIKISNLIYEEFPEYKKFLNYE